MRTLVGREASNAEWVACFGAALAVQAGGVACPLRGHSVLVAVCLDCRYLSATADERSPDRDCRVPECIG